MRDEVDRLREDCREAHALLKAMRGRVLPEDAAALERLAARLEAAAKGERRPE